MKRIKQSEIQAYRLAYMDEQLGKCDICQINLAGRVMNLDHEHKTGKLRSVLCRECNTLLGKVENFLNTYGHPRGQMFLSRAWDYIQHYKKHPRDIYHPSYRTPEEKRLAKNARARAKRAREKELDSGFKLLNDALSVTSKKKK